MLSQIPACEGSAIIRILVFRIETNGFGVIFKGALELTAARIAISPDYIRLRKLRVQPDGLVRVSQRSLRLLQQIVHGGAIRVERRLGRIEFDGLGERCQRALVIVCIKFGYSLREVSRRE